jgi:hypothetical protein
MGLIEDQIREHGIWAEANANRIESREIGNVAADLKEGSEAALRCIPDSLNALATVHGSRGVAGLRENRPDATLNVARAIEYQAVALIVRANMYFRSSADQINLTNYVARAACLICCSRKWARTAERILRKAIETPGAVDRAYWQQRRFEPFVLACCDLLNGVGTNRDLREPYASALVNWHDMDGLARAMVAVCQYHVKNMNDKGQAWDPEFKHVPFDLLPCEVMLVRSCCHQLGRPMPIVEHKLVEFYDDQVGELPEVSGDSIIDAVLASLE